MKSKLYLLLLVVSATSACNHSARLYPVQGPLSKQTPVPVLIAKITGAFTPGDIKVVLSDGEVCQGHWNVVNPAKAAKGSNTATAPNNDMSSAWDSIYGPGFYVSRVLGARYYAQAVVTGNRGTILNVEMYRPVGDRDVEIGAIKGVAKDNRDNLYKLVL